MLGVPQIRVFSPANIGTQHSTALERDFVGLRGVSRVKRTSTACQMGIVLGFIADAAIVRSRGRADLIWRIHHICKHRF